jgi:hypothetical protein
MLARGGFDPPTFGLWAQHASPAPPRYTSIAHF